MSYVARDASAVDMEADLIALWKANLQMGGDPRDKFRWFYVGNPLGSGRAFVVDSVGHDGAKTVGTCGLGSRTLFCRGRSLRAGLLADFAVDRGHRTVMPGLILQRALANYARASFDLTYAFPNKSAVGIFTRIGYRLLGRTGRYVKLLRLEPLVFRYLKSRRFARLASLLPNALLAWTDRTKAAPLPRTLQLVWTRDLDPRFERLWERVRTSHAVIGERTVSFLRWRFTERPGLPADVAALVDSETGALRAYAAVVEKVKGVALVADFVGEDDDALQALFRRLFVSLRERGFHQATTFFMGAPRIEQLLRDVGFSFRNAAKNVVLDTTRTEPELLDTGNWYLTDADRDN